jgi:hypothetical protein
MSISLANNISSQAAGLTSSGALGDGIGMWAGLAKTIRIATRGGGLYPPFTNTGTYIDVTKAQSYYLVYCYFT